MVTLFFWKSVKSTATVSDKAQSDEESNVIVVYQWGICLQLDRLEIGDRLELKESQNVSTFTSATHCCGDDNITGNDVTLVFNIAFI